MIRDVLVYALIQYFFFISGTEKRDCDDMNTIARFFLLQAISLCFAIVISVGGIVDGILGIRKMKKDEVREFKKTWNPQGQ